MKQIKYTNLDIQFSLDSYSFNVLNLVYEKLDRIIPKHSHSLYSYELHYIVSGYGQAIIDSKHYTLTPNTLYVTGPGIEHEQIPDSKNPMNEFCIYLKVAPSKTIPQNVIEDESVVIFDNTPFWLGQDTNGIKHTIEQIFNEMEQKSLGYRLQVKSLLQQCIIQLIRNYTATSSTKNMKSYTQFDKSNLFDQKYIVVEESFLYKYKDITLINLSKNLGLSPRQTERLLKEHYGKTFLQKKNESRMSAAAALLQNTDKSLTEISMELGYSSVEHFSNAFKRFFHVSPGRYRKAIL